MQNKRSFLYRSVLALWLLALFASARPAQAQAVLNPAGGSVTGALDATHTVVNYSYKVTADADATLTLTTSANLRAYIYFYDADGTTSLLNPTFVGFGATGTLAVPHLSPGATYFVHAVLYDGSGTFTLASSVTPPAVANDAEPDNDPAHALTFAVNTSKTGHLGYSLASYSSVDTADWYKVTVPKDGDLTYTLTTDANLRAQIYFYDSDGTTSPLNPTFVGFGSTGTLTVPHLAPGTIYYVVIQRYDGYGGYTIVNSEALPVIKTQAAANNTPSTALPFASGGTVTGHEGYSLGTYANINTSVYYSFVAPADSDVTFTLTTDPTFPLRAQIFFYDSDGTTYIANSSLVPSNSSDHLTIGHLAPGTTYYVLVQRYDGYGGYTLTNSASTPVIATQAAANNSPANALPFASGATVTGHEGYSLGSYSNVNTQVWYSFVAPADSDVTFTLTTDGVFPLRAQIFFYDSDKTTAIANSNLVAANSSGQLTIGHLAPGATYYVLVQRYDGYGGYTLSNTAALPVLANDLEKNDTPQTALLLPINGAKTGHLGYSRTAYTDVDVSDWYKLTASQNGDVTFTLTMDSVFPLRAYIYFYDSDGTTQITNSNLVAANSSGQLTIGHLAPGATYYVLVQRYDGYGDYTLSDVLTPVGNSINPIPGTTSGTAATFPPNSNVTGNLGYSQGSYSSVTTSAWYSFVAPRDSDVTFTLATDVLLPLRAYIYFYDSDQMTQIAVSSLVPSNSSGQLTIGHLAPGATYYVLVQRYDGYGGYTLSNTVAPLFVANDAEPNDTFDKAIALNNLSNITGHLGYSRTSYNDVDAQDWYKIALPVGNFQANISLSGSLRASLYLVAPDGSTQLTNTPLIGGGGNAQLTYNIPTAGTYYLAVSRYDGYGAYDINQPVTATVYGTVTLDSIAQFAPAQTVNVEFRPQPSGAAFTRQISVGYNGAYFISNVPRGKYNLAFKGYKWLRKVVVGLDVTVGDANDVNAFLTAGDANNDNSVDSTDFGILIGAFNTAANIPNSGYDVNADFNCDGFVDSSDFGILIGNFNMRGDK